MAAGRAEPNCAANQINRPTTHPPPTPPSSNTHAHRGQLVYPNADAAYGRQAACQPVGCNYGCIPFNESAPPVVLKKEPGKRYIMLLDRGPSESHLHARFAFCMLLTQRVCLHGPYFKRMYGPRLHQHACRWSHARLPNRQPNRLAKPTSTGEAESLPRPCFFLDKAYHAQQAGADALLVINDNEGDLSTAVAPKDEDSTR